MWFFQNNKKSRIQIEEMKVRAIKESVDALTKGMTGALTEVITVLDKKIDIRMSALENLIRRNNEIVVVDDERSEAHAFYLTRKAFTTSGQNAMLVVVIAKNDGEAADKAIELLRRNNMIPAEWNIDVSQKISILIRGKNQHIPLKEKPFDSYILDLSYARDKFADTPHEKAIITKLINKAKEKYERIIK